MSTAPASPSAAPLASIQILRAVAALAVVMFHLGVAMSSELGLTEYNIFEYGEQGVDLFFVISGFIMCYTTQKDWSPINFAYKRLARIVPLYYALTLMVFAVAVVAPEALNSTVASLSDLLRSLAFLPYQKANGLVEPMLFVGWTLNYEMFFYAIFAVALLVGRRRRIAVVAALILAIVVFGRLYQGDHVQLRFYTSGLILEFLLGCLVFVVFDKAPKVVQVAKYLWPAAVAAIVFFKDAFDTNPSGLLQAIVFGVPAAVILTGWLAIAPPRTRLVSAFERLGDASYSIYLVHAPVIQAFVKGLVPLLGGGAVVMIASLVGAVAATIAASLATHALFERPACDWLRRQLARLVSAGRQVLVKSPAGAG